ncbi:hypothetical protein [Persephonella sp.]
MGKVRVLMLMLPLLFLFSTSQANLTGELEFKPEKEIINKYEKVCFYLVNNSDKVVYLPSSAPWAVFEDEDFDKIVFSPIAAQQIIKLQPDQERKWCWDLKDFEGEIVPSGDYSIRLTVFRNGERVFLTSKVKVKPGVAEATKKDDK